MTLSLQQQDALNRILNFVNDSSKSVFILKGYAGTGKTTLIKTIIPNIKELGKDVFLMAPTGRAAKVLRDKAEYEASTIHHCIYQFDKMQVVRYDEKGNLIVTEQIKSNQNFRSKGLDDIQFWFSLKTKNIDTNPSDNVYIVDESSMISSRTAKNETIHFGTDILIEDLLTFAQTNLGGKIIFVGNPAQLPPVGDNRSAALDEEYFRIKGMSVVSFTLTEVFRQKGENLILKNAMKIRDLLLEGHRNQLCFDRKEKEVEDMTPEQVIDSFYENNPSPNIGDSVIICYSNSLAKDYNDVLHERYFPNSKHVMAGEVLQVVRNNINNVLNYDYFNGDFVKVIEVSENVETQSAPVWIDEAGVKKRSTISLDFRDVVLLSEDGTQTKCKIVDTLLNSREPNLTHLQSVAMFINFRMRNPQLKQNEEAFSETLRQDPYYNAVQVKYGYSITGHKSQGGEWKTVYVDYTGRNGLNDDSLKWAYTATTRAKQTLYGVNIPNVTPISALKFNPIMRIARASNEAFSFAETNDESFLPESAKSFQKQKCISVKEKLDDAGFLLVSVQPCQYNDKYTIETQSGTVIIDCYYNASGQYTRYIPETIISENEQLMTILKDDSGIQYAFDYKPSEDAFEKLYVKMKSLCDDLDIKITNIVEHVSQFYICYYLITSGKFSMIQFFFDKNHMVTRAIPSSDLETDDEKMKQLIQYLQ